MATNAAVRPAATAAQRPRSPARTVPRVVPLMPARPKSARVALTSTRGSAVRSSGSRPGGRLAVKAAAAGSAWVSASPAEALPPTDNESSELHTVIYKGLGSAVLLAAAAVSMLLANSAVGPAWVGLWSSSVGPSLGGLQLTLSGLINEGLMAIFFFVAGLQIKRECTLGSLSNLKSALLPCLAALGGLIAPVALFTALNLGGGGLLSGWAVPMATDIVFALGVLGFFSSKVPPAVPAFLVTFGVVNNVGAIGVMTAFSKYIGIPYVIAGASVAVSLFLLPKLFKKVNGWMYAVGGAAMWYCLLLGGVNACVAGVAAGLAVPAAQWAPQESEAPGRQPGLMPTMIDHLIYNLLPFTALLVLPLFALANTAAPIQPFFFGLLFTKPVATGILAGLLLGKPLGIVGASLLGVKLGLAEMPQGMDTKHLAVLGLLGSIGFTMSLLMISLALGDYPDSTRLSKLAVVLTSGVAAIGSAAIMTTLPDTAQAEEEPAPAAPTSETPAYPEEAQPEAAAETLEYEYSADYTAGYHAGYSAGYYTAQAAAAAQGGTYAQQPYQQEQPADAAYEQSAGGGSSAEYSADYTAGYQAGYSAGYYAFVPAAASSSEAAYPQQAYQQDYANGYTQEAYPEHSNGHAPQAQPQEYANGYAQQTYPQANGQAEAAEAPEAAHATSQPESPPPAEEPSAEEQPAEAEEAAPAAQQPASVSGQYSPEQLAFLERRQQELAKAQSGQ
eukprot:jgi/Tetstr1/439174/TSEL_002994.t1